MKYFLTLYILAIVTLIGVAGFRGDVSRKPPIAGLSLMWRGRSFVACLTRILR